MNIVLNISCSKVWNNNKFWVMETKNDSNDGFMWNVVTDITHQWQFVTTNRCESVWKNVHLYTYSLVFILYK